MESQLGINTTTYYVILPLLVIVVAAIIWFVAKMKATVWKRVTLSVVGLFAFVGFSVITLCIYYQVNDSFAGTFKFYAYSALAPDERDPFTDHSDSQSILMMRAVGYSDGEVRMQYHPNPYAPTITYLFVPGKLITANLQDDVLTYFVNKKKAVENTSFWWALTKDIYTLIADSANQDSVTIQDLGHNFISQVPTGWKLKARSQMQ